MENCWIYDIRKFTLSVVEKVVCVEEREWEEEDKNMDDGGMVERRIKLKKIKTKHEQTKTRTTRHVVNVPVPGNYFESLK